MKKILEWKLRFIARQILKKYNPKLVGITGSLGKTSTKEAVYAVLSCRYRVRRSAKNYNNEIGLPLTIIGEESPGKDLVGWLIVFLKSCKLILFRDKDFPEIIVLEMGVDRPGDMKYLTDITKCDIGIITSIGASHLEYFGSVKNIQKEKGALLDGLKEGGTAILNIDDSLTNELVAKSKRKTIKYGFSKSANLKASDIFFGFEKNSQKIQGILFKVSYNGSVIPFMLPNVIGYPAVYSALAGIAVGISFDIDLTKISDSLKSFKMPPGRMNLINGIKQTTIIDDSYNSSNPAASISAFEFIKKVKLESGRKIAILSDMLEMGKMSEEGHETVGEKAAKSGIDKLILVGERARDIARGAKKAGMKGDDIFNFSNSLEAAKFVQDRIKKGDLIFIKGSQGMRMERIVKEIMAEPMRAKELLVRQGKEWD